MYKILLLFIFIIILFYIINNLLHNYIIKEKFNNKISINELFYYSINKNFDIIDTKKYIDYNNKKITAIKGNYIYYDIITKNKEEYIILRYPDFSDEILRHQKIQFYDFFTFLKNNFINNNKKYIFDFVGFHGILDNKVRLWIKLKDKYGRNIANTVMPKTYLIPNDYDLFLNEYQENKKYILKNSYGGARSALLITDSKKDILNYFYENKNINYDPYNCEDAVCHSKVKYNIIQEYIIPKFFMKDYKFGIRLFLVLTQDKKLLYNNGFCYYSSEKYNSSNNLDNNVVGSILKINNVIKNNNFPYTFKDFITYCNKNIENSEIKINNLINKLKTYFNLIIESNKNELFYFKKYNNIKTFDIFAFDIEFDDDFNPTIFEGNHYFIRYYNNPIYNNILIDLYNSIYKELGLIQNSNNNNNFYKI
jgi:hypothetical protein